MSGLSGLGYRASFLVETTRLGLANIWLHKLRSVLTALGIILGVAAVIAMVSIGEGKKQDALATLERLGAKNIILRSQKPPETVQQQARSKYRHKKQTGGAGQFADIAMLVEPLNGDFVPPADISVRKEHNETTAWGSTIQFIDGIVGGVIDMRRFFGAIQKGIMEALQNGPIAGYPVGDVRVVIYDGGMHSVDSNEAAFKTAARMCFRAAFRDASPVMLEPIHNIEVLVPDTYTGDVMGDMNTRRARIQGIDAEGPFQKIVHQLFESFARWILDKRVHFFWRRR